MENIVTEIEKKYHEKEMVYRDLLNIFIKEKQSIVNGDVTALWRFSSEKQKLAKDIETIRDSILDALECAEIKHDMNQNTFQLKKVSELFSGDDLRCLTESLIEINRVKKQIQLAGKANYHFIEEYLVTINEIMDVFVGNNRKTALYNNKSAFSRNRGNETVLLSREV